MMYNLTELFQSLESIARNDGKDCFSTTLIPGYEAHRLGKDARGRPLLLISIIDVPGQRQPAPISLKHLKVMYGLKCRVSCPDSAFEERRFTIILCTGEDSTLHAYFLRVASTILISLKNRPTQSEVAHAMDRLIELFRAMTTPSRKSVQGLWAELFPIAQSRQPTILVDAWHMLPEDRYDFAMDDQRIEVKSFSGSLRQHHFSLEQLQPPEGVKTLIASMLVEGSQAGESIVDLREKIQTHISSDSNLLLHLDKVIALTLGNSWQQADEACFDQRLAQESLAFYEAAAIPSVNPNLPSGVSGVHFRSDLTGIPTVEISRYDAENGLFHAALC
jgi:hypothetical protein